MKFVVSIFVVVCLAAAYSMPTESEALNEKKYNDFNLSESDQPIPLRLKREPKKKHRNVEANVDVQRSRGGTDLNAGVNGQIWQSQNGRSELNGGAGYSRHYGGQGGTGRPNYNVGVQFTHRFK